MVERQSLTAEVSAVAHNNDNATLTEHIDFFKANAERELDSCLHSTAACQASLSLCGPCGMIEALREPRVVQMYTPREYLEYIPQSTPRTIHVLYT